MRSVVHHPYFVAAVTRHLGPQYDLDEQYMLLEWILARETSFDAYPIIAQRPNGLTLRSFRSTSPWLTLRVTFYEDLTGTVVHLYDAYGVVHGPKPMPPPVPSALVSTGMKKS